MALHSCGQAGLPHHTSTGFGMVAMLWLPCPASSVWRHGMVHGAWRAVCVALPGVAWRGLPSA